MPKKLPSICHVCGEGVGGHNRGKCLNVEGGKWTEPPEFVEPFWKKSSYQGEYSCPHGIGHGNHVHSCDGCCGRPDFPLRNVVTREQRNEMAPVEHTRLIERRLRQLWDIVKSGNVSMLPEFDRADADNFRVWGLNTTTLLPRCIYCGVDEKRHSKGTCCRQK